jgi:predicted GTPase
MENSAGRRVRVVIMGAAGRDFHVFQTVYKDDPATEVVAFTATQIPGIDERTFPAEIAGPLYPEGIAIVPEAGLPKLIADQNIERVVFAYSDIAYADLMHRASLVLACGADFVFHGPDATMVPASCPVVSICAVRTGVGKSGITKHVWGLLAERGVRAVAVRHPMPYRDLLRMRVERYETRDDLDAARITVEEREEYEHLVERGIVVYAGVDYGAIIDAASAEADVVIWDGGNNDTPFVRPDLEICALDPHRPGHERGYFPGEVNFLRADVLVINKVDTACSQDVAALEQAAELYNPGATVVRTASAIHIEDGGAELLAGKRALVIEDGPTVTHGGMEYGAGVLAARGAGAHLVDPRPGAVGSIAATFAAYPHLTDVLPAMGYSAEQLAELEATIAACDCDVVVIGTPIDLSRLVKIGKPSVRVTYAVEDAGEPTLADVIDGFVARFGLGTKG